MKRVTDYLQQLDLSESESQIYLTLLQAGPLSVRDLAHAVGIKRTNAYLYVDRLLEKGLITKLVQKSRTQVAANPPKGALQNLIEQRIEADKQMQKDLPDVIAKIQDVVPKPELAGDIDIRYYEGKQGVKKIYEEILQTKEQRSFVDISAIAQVFPENFDLFQKAFKKNPKMSMWEIVENSPYALEYIGEISQKDNYKYKILPKNTKLTAQDILIYDNKVAFIHLKDKVNGIVLQSADLFNNFKVLFDLIWKTLPPKTNTKNI